jgi:cadmium resistance protein CadD (predicted permease)
MDSLVTLVSLAVMAFVSTNIDDAFVLVGFFADKNFRTHDVVIGQYLGISALCAASMIFALIALVIPPAYIGLLGLVPIAIGINKLVYPGRARESEKPGADIDGHGRRLAVAAVTIANGGDNIATYTALFATRGGFEVPVIGIVFAVLTGLWCFAAHWLVNHRVLGTQIRAQARRVIPFLLIGLGALIIFRAGTIHLLKL